MIELTGIHKQIIKGKDITYGDLVRYYIELNDGKKTFKKIASTRYINFLSDYLANEKNASREEAIAAWHELKELDIPKTYKDWKKAQ